MTKPLETRRWLDEMLGRPAWQQQALCRDRPDIDWFPASATPIDDAKVVCRRCPVVEQCRAYALVDPSLGGVWGGTSARERQRIRIKRAA